MPIRVAVNGFGRIGRLVSRQAFGQPDFTLVAINDLTDAKTLAHLLKYDSVHGIWPRRVEAAGDAIRIDGVEVKVTSEKDPLKLPWAALKVDVVIESTGKFTKPEDAEMHVKAGAKRVIISAPFKNPRENDLTIVMGVNDHKFDASKHFVVSTASCTTNCFAPVVKLLNDAFGILRGEMTTVHAFTNDQKILDFPHKDLRRARSAFTSIIPTSTGAAKAIGLVIPELKGKMGAVSLRVPVPDGSICDIAVEVSKSTTKDEVNAVLKKGSESGPLKGYLEYSETELVSHDIVGNPHSAIVDSLLTDVSGGTMIKVFAWYDNEWGYSSRMVDMMKLMAGR
jgi:glyceraldehyde 3-phosphate dehydrogenase